MSVPFVRQYRYCTREREKEREALANFFARIKKGSVEERTKHFWEVKRGVEHAMDSTVRLFSQAMFARNCTFVFRGLAEGRERERGAPSFVMDSES